MSSRKSHNAILVGRTNNANASAANQSPLLEYNLYASSELLVSAGVRRELSLANLGQKSINPLLGRPDHCSAILVTLSDIAA